jgi:ABC-type Fe3+/spermidine/putrescine transport system ATPase subunit
MLDEPMGSLDRSLRERLVTEVRDIIKQVGLTAIYVTHDQEEAYAIADRVAVMNGGLIEQVDAPETVYRRPETVFVARFLGLNNVLDSAQAQTLLGLPETALLHPDGLSLAVDGQAARVFASTFRGDHYRIEVEVAGIHLQFNHPSRLGQPPARGETVALGIDPAYIIPLHD